MISRITGWFFVICMLASTFINPTFLSCRVSQNVPVLLFGSYAPQWQGLSHTLNTPDVPCTLGRFRNGEVSVEVKESTENKDVVVIQSVFTHEGLMELLLVIDALKRDGCKRVTACLPYLGYMRQDKRVYAGTPISARLLVKILESAGCDRFIVCDLHAKQIEGFFDRPVRHISAMPLFEDDIRQRFGEKDHVVIVSPDSGGLHRARHLAKRLKVALAVVDKYRKRPGQSEVLQILGDVAGKTCVIVDDMVDSGGTLMNAATALKALGAREVHCYCTHGVLSHHAADNIAKSAVDSLTLSDSLPVTSSWQKLRFLSVAPLVAQEIMQSMATPQENTEST